MDDVLLFQAACRVNRWRKWKADCLLVDFSHEGVVSQNLPKVFAKYGGITVSDFDALTLMAKMDAAFKAFFKDDKDIIAHWKSWRATQRGGKDKDGAIGLSDFLDDLVKHQKPRAVALRKAGSAWLGCRERLWGILDFTKPELVKHADDQRAAFAEQVVRHLAAKLQDEDDRVGAVFDIDLVEDAIGWGLDAMPEPPKNKKTAKGEDLPHTIGALMGSLDAMELLAALELTEKQKLVLIEKLKAFLILLFGVIDAEGRLRNNDIYRKLILEMATDGRDFPWDERFGSFKAMLDVSANNLKIAFHPAARALLAPLMKRAELVMADYEEWITSGGTSIVLSQTALEQHADADSAESGSSLKEADHARP
jgi:type I restriction enzyme R subunit